MDSTICFEISVVVLEAICGRCASFMVLAATVSEKIGGQTNSSILVVGAYRRDYFETSSCIPLCWILMADSLVRSI